MFKVSGTRSRLAGLSQNVGAFTLPTRLDLESVNSLSVNSVDLACFPYTIQLYIIQHAKGKDTIKVPLRTQDLGCIENQTCWYVVRVLQKDAIST